VVEGIEEGIGSERVEGRTHLADGPEPWMSQSRAPLKVTSSRATMAPGSAQAGGIEKVKWRGEAAGAAAERAAGAGASSGPGITHRSTFRYGSQWTKAPRAVRRPLGLNIGGRQVGVWPGDAFLAPGLWVEEPEVPLPRRAAVGGEDHPTAVRGPGRQVSVVADVLAGAEGQLADLAVSSGVEMEVEVAVVFEGQDGPPAVGRGKDAEGEDRPATIACDPADEGRATFRQGQGKELEVRCPSRGTA